jgi:hypothetical protein
MRRSTVPRLQNGKADRQFWLLGIVRIDIPVLALMEVSTVLCLQNGKAHRQSYAVGMVRIDIPMPSDMESQGSHLGPSWSHLGAIFVLGAGKMILGGSKHEIVIGS